MAPLDDALEALGDYRRRQLLLALREPESRTGSVSVPEDVVDGSPTDRLMVGYTHVHLPLLDQQGYIDWDRRHHEVARGPRFDELEPLLEAVEEFDGS